MHWLYGFLYLLAPTNSLAFGFSSLFSRADNQSTANDLSRFLWLADEVHEGKTFFDGWKFFNYEDPTKGQVSYQDKNSSFAKGLVYFQDDGRVVMRADSWTTLPPGAYRDSVRIETLKHYNGGLFILDVDRAPWGCATWPAFWTVGVQTPGNEAASTWPANGEIDILEGVHDNEHNQVTWHTSPGCELIPTSNFTGTPVAKPFENGTISCHANANNFGGCGVTEWSRASYGEYFNENHGGVFAMKWDEEGISVWSFFRAAVPQDIIEGRPDPPSWLKPSATLSALGCDPYKYFANHTIVFDITFCGNLAGNVQTPGCPGRCEDKMMEPLNFVNASWTINSVKTYKKSQPLGQIVNPNGGQHFNSSWVLITTVLVFGLAALF